MIYAMVKSAGHTKENVEPSKDSIAQPQGG